MAQSTRDWTFARPWRRRRSGSSRWPARSTGWWRLASGLFNESILAERGFTPDVYHNALAITAITGLGGNFVAGAWAERGSLRSVLVVAMMVLGAALAALPHVTTNAHVVMQAVAMGIAGGFVMVVFFSFWGRAYGHAHLGRIQGAAQVMTVLASAVGPLLLAWCVDVTGSYAAAFYALAARSSSSARPPWSRGCLHKGDCPLSSQADNFRACT